MEWKLADAKNRFSEVVRRALTVGPQRVRRRDDAVVVISEEEYDRLTGKRAGFGDFILDAPRMDDLDLARDRSAIRDAGL